MSTPDRTNSAGSDRLLDLMCDHATCGLSDADRAEFEALCAQFPELNDGSIERAAAAADLAAQMVAAMGLAPLMAATVENHQTQSQTAKQMHQKAIQKRQTANQVPG